MRLGLIISLLFFALATRPASAGEVVVYTSVDQPFAEPILREFETRTGNRVRAIYDVEATKTTGLVNRLIAERNNPRADVFWNSEIVRTLVLKRKGILTPYFSPSAQDIPGDYKDREGYWAGFAARARVLIINTELLSAEEAPTSIFELTESRWRGRFTMAYPLFGTTATHVAALFVSLGDDAAKQYLQALRSNNVRVVDGNSVTRDRVAYGMIPIGFTDTDDANVAVQAGRNVAVIYPDQEGIGTLLIPNTVALINGSPNPEAGKALIDYLLDPEIERKLAFGSSAQIPVRVYVERPPHVPLLGEIKTMPVDYIALTDRLDEIMQYVHEMFFR